MKPDPSAADEAPLKLLVQREQVRLAVDQLKRIPVPHFLLDACLAWTAASAGLGWFAWAWLGVMTIAQVGRSIYLVRLYKQGRVPPARMQVLLTAWLAFLGALHAVQVVLVFMQPAGTAQYIMTMILVGNAAGAVSPAAGDLRAYVSWAVVYGGTLVLCWVFQGTAEGAAIGGLIVFLFVVLSLYVRDQGSTLEQLVRLTESVRRERDRAERASQAKTRFFAAASHDLRQPLTALSYNAATVQALASLGNDETLTRVSEAIGRALQESRSLVDSLLEVSELDAGVVQPQRSLLDVHSLLASVRDTYAPLARDRGLALDVDEADPQKPLHALTDSALLRRILQNLVANAIKFTQRGSVQLRVEPDERAGMLVISVQDTGPGIPAAAQERVFEEFFQLGNLERNRSQGLGLGLAIVRRLATLIDADVRLHSPPGGGCTFEVRVPQMQAPAAAPQAAEAERPQHAWIAPVAGAPAGRRVLVVDDEPQVRNALETLLSTMGWEVAAVVSEEEALRLWQQGFAPDALIVDFRLQGGASGLDVLMALRRLGCNAPAWMVTGDTEPTRILAARAAGVPVIYKPVDGLHLVRLLQAALAPDGPPA